MSALKACFFGALLLAVAPPAAAQTLGADNCRATSAIVAEAVAGRTAGASAAQVQAKLTQGDGAVSAELAPTVPLLVDWVYSLRAEAATPALVTQFEKQCMAY